MHFSCFSQNNTACLKANAEVAVSEANSAGLIKGTSASSSFATSLISKESVDTMYRSKYFDNLASFIVKYNKGLLATLTIFFLGMLLEPPRAKVTPKILASS